ncbi:MAG: hypothetical protein IJW78_03530 [Clostridia bacterium]|nr:hypothetical protein [Clostridia bacterium]
MRRGIALFCVVVTLLCLVGCQKKQTYGVYEVIITETLIANHSVGNEWQITYTCDGKAIVSGEQRTAPLDEVQTLTIDATVTEVDKLPDTGQGALAVILKDGFSTSTVVTITENKGCYYGQEAEWEITCEVKLLQEFVIE